MNRIFAAVAALTLGTLVSAGAAAAPAKPMTYDCTKAGNKNKAACKGTAPMAATPAAKPVPVVKTTAAPKSATPAKPMTYDCTKAGNKNKAACKSAAPAPSAAMTPVAKPVASMAAPAPATAARPATPMAAAPTVAAAARPHAPKAPAAVNPNVVQATTKTGKIVHYDCSKKGNMTKTACKR